MKLQTELEYVLDENTQINPITIKKILLDIRKKINEFIAPKTKNLRDILNAVEEGSFIIEVDNDNSMKINLNNVKKIFKEYREITEGGCIYCKKYNVINSILGDVRAYCGLYEKESDVDLIKGVSPRIDKYLSVGCSEIEREYNVRLEEIIQE